MPELARCTAEEFDAFLAAYPRTLVTDVARICEPPMMSWNDFTIGVWPQSAVATCQLDDIRAEPGEFREWPDRSGRMVRESGWEIWR